jgi:hypothetical protein
MATMKRRTAIAVTVGVWLAAAGSAAALTYDLNRPLHLAKTTLLRAAPVSAMHAAAPVSEIESVLVIPTITVVGRAPRNRDRDRDRAVVPEPKAREFSDMVCSDWRELDMGSGRVQVCE